MKNHSLLLEKSDLTLDASLDLEDSISSSPYPLRQASKSSWIDFWLYAYLILLHIVILVLYVTPPRNGRSEQLEPSFSPALPAIDHELHELAWSQLAGHWDSSGQPSSDETNDAWNSLLEPMYFNSSREEMELANEDREDAVETSQGGYQTALSVYHDLHCLLQPRQFLYKEVYFPNFTEALMAYETEHLDHCIDALPRSIMCAGDISLYTFHWKDDVTKKPNTKTSEHGVCIDWEVLQAWPQKRMIPRHFDKKLSLQEVK